MGDTSTLPIRPSIGLDPDTDPCPFCGASLEDECGFNPEQPLADASRGGERS